MLIFDTNIQRHVGQTDVQFDVTQICQTFILVEWTEEGQQDFDNYKQELADANPQPQGEQDGEVTGGNEGVEIGGTDSPESGSGSTDDAPVSTD
jgi:hypothetical protein